VLIFIYSTLFGEPDRILGGANAVVVAIKDTSSRVLVFCTDVSVFSIESIQVEFTKTSLFLLWKVFNCI
jgi:hypothetical protein